MSLYADNNSFIVKSNTELYWEMVYSKPLVYCTGELKLFYYHESI